jgi:acyl-CoA thioester hydrolase
MEADAQLLEQFPVVIVIPVAWGEMDAFRHINSAAYFRYIESGRVAYFDRIGLLESFGTTGIGPILASTACRFRFPLTYPDTVSVATWISSLGDDRFKMETRIVSQRNSRTAAEAQSLVVMFDYRRGEKARLTLQIRRRIEKLQATRGACHGGPSRHPTKIQPGFTDD